MNVKMDAQKFGKEIDAALDIIALLEGKVGAGKNLLFAKVTIPFHHAKMFLSIVRNDVRITKFKLPREDILSKQVVTAALLMRELHLQNEDPSSANRVINLCSLISIVPVDPNKQFRAEKVSQWCNYMFYQTSSNIPKD